MVKTGFMQILLGILVCCAAAGLPLFVGGDLARAGEAPGKAPAAASSPVAAPAGPVAAPAGPVTAPALASWLESVKNATGGIPRQLAILRTLPKLAGKFPEFLPIDKAKFDSLSYLRVADFASSDWDFKLNVSKLKKVDPFDAVIQITGADTVILAPEQGDWKILRKVEDEATVVHSGKGPASLTPDAIISWLFSSFNWDGVVLAQTSDYLLVGSSTAALAQPQIQALAVSNSEDKLRLSAAERKGSGLLSLSENSGGFGVFDIVVLGQGVTKIMPGTKVILEKKK